MRNSKIDFAKVAEDMKRHGLPTGANTVRFQVPNAKELLRESMEHFVGKEGKKLKWLKPYDDVAEWLSDNKGKGLFLYGNVGQGKSIIGRLAIPSILLLSQRKVVKVYDVNLMNSKLDEVKQIRMISLDDIGTEAIINAYGNKRSAFSEIMDNAEKTGQLVIISTNLDKEELIEKYGDRVFDRIIATTKRVLFKGESLRG